METWGASVVSSPVDQPRHPGALGLAISDAVRDAASRDDSHYTLGSVLNLPADTALEPSASLLDLGVDSLLALDLRKKLKKAAGVNVPLATILGGATVAEVLEHLERPEKKARLK